MNSTQAAGRRPSRADPRATPETLFHLLESLIREIPGLISDRIELFSLEVTRAGIALAQIVMLLIAAAIMGVTAWLALWAGLVLCLIELDLHWSLALLVVLVANLGAGWLALLRLKRLSKCLALPATRRHLTGRGGFSDTRPATMALTPGTASSALRHEEVPRQATPGAS